MKLYWFSPEWMKEHGITWADHITNTAVHKTKSIQSDEEEDEHVTDLDEQDDYLPSTRFCNEKVNRRNS